MELTLKTTKFPYIFWGFNKNYKYILNKEKETLKNTHTLNTFHYKKMNKWLYLALKYLPVLIVFGIVFNLNDFSFSRDNITAYLFATLFVLSVTFLENLARKVALAIVFVSCIAFGFYINDYVLIAYALKYFILLFTLCMLYLDCFNNPYYLLRDDKVVSNFLIGKEKDKL